MLKSAEFYSGPHRDAIGVVEVPEGPGEGLEEGPRRLRLQPVRVYSFPETFQTAAAVRSVKSAPVSDELEIRVPQLVYLEHG